MISKLEELVLQIVSRANGSATASFVQSELTMAAKQEMKFGAVFNILDRLPNKKLVRSKLGLRERRPVGKFPKVFRITAAGAKALAGADYATHVAKHGGGLQLRRAARFTRK